MPIFITGGTGFLGVNLVRHLVAQGRRVRLLVRGEPGRLGLESESIDFARGDVTDPESIRAAMRGCEEVYHLAGWVQVSSWGWETAKRVNVEGTRNVCEAALALGVRRLVHTSSIAAIATGTLEDPADEGTPWNLDGLGIPYYATKRASEDVVLNYVRTGLDAVIVNPSYVIGPWDIKPSAGRLLIHIAAGHLPVVPALGGINYVDVRQVAAGMALAMESGCTGERYFLGGENLSFQSFCAKAAMIAGVAPPRFAVPRGVLLPLAAAGSALGMLWPDRFRDLNLGVLRIGSLEHYATSKKACGELGYREIPVDAAIADALDWFDRNGYMPRISAARRRKRLAVVE